MSDLIERKEAIEAIKKYGKDAISAGRKHIDQVDDIVELCNMLAALPAVEAAPVVHGRWVEYPVAHYFKCSKCKYIVPYKKAVRINEKQAYNYCPSCGAKMDGEGEPNGK